MIYNNIGSNCSEKERKEKSLERFNLKPVNLPEAQNNILCMSTSKKYIYIITESSELLCMESHNLSSNKQIFSIQSEDPSASNLFKEKLTRIWTDREGNHSIIRLRGKVYYFNPLISEVKELNIFKGVEICAVGYNNKNKSNITTGRFLAADYNNNIYDCSISLIQNKNGYSIKDERQIVSTLNFKDWDCEEDEDINDKLNNDRIYGIRFFKSSKKEEKMKEEEKEEEKEKEEEEEKEEKEEEEEEEKEEEDEKDINSKNNFYYIIMTTRTKLYQLYGEGQNFKQAFDKYNDSTYNDSCKYFPQIKRNRDFKPLDLEMLYKRNNKITQFGWKTEAGFCFGFYEKYNNLPSEIKKFTVIPFAKITHDGDKRIELEPISVTHSLNHIFILFKDCLTIISKITSNIIHTKYFKTEYKEIIYNEFSSDGGNILLFSKTSLYEIPLNNESKDIWKDYLDIGDFKNAIRKCNKNETFIRLINRINAEEAFNKKKYYKSSKKYAESSERFENVCLKFIMNDQLDCLDNYLKSYLEKNIPRKIDPEKEQKFIIQRNLICTLLVEVFLNKKISNKESALQEFRLLIRGKSEYLKDSRIIFQLLESHGRMDEFVEFASIMGDYENVILYYINQHDISGAIEKLTLFAAFTNEDGIKILSQIFLNYCHIFFKNNPKESISLVQQRFKKIEMKAIVQAIMSSTDNDKEIISNDIKNNPKPLIKEKNYQAILNYLKTLIEKTEIDEKNNIHNLYIYYLSKNKSNQETIIEYLKGPLKEKKDFFKEKKEALFQIDYAKKLFKNNPAAYSLILAIMGKYLEGVKTALKTKTEECLKIAKFIADNAPGDKLKKDLWIEIFSDTSQNKFKEALNILTEKKILKIEDVLPYITDTIKIEDFKKQISECINDYENNINKLKEDIFIYNKAADNIKNDIEKLKKNSKDIQYSNCKCTICQGYIKDKDIYLFPCGHMFDANCIRECLLEYEATGLNSIHNDNVKIDKYFKDLGLIKESVFIEKKNREKKIVEEEQQQGKSGIFINKIFDKKGGKKQENTLAKNNNKKFDLKKVKEELNEILSRQCVLCGDYIVDSIQNSICIIESPKSNKNYKIKLEDSFDWDYPDY